MTEEGVPVPLGRLLTHTGFGPRSECPRCGRQSKLSAVDGGECLECSIRTGAGRAFGEGVWSGWTDNMGLGFRTVPAAA